jgi:hypothetical protein
MKMVLAARADLSEPSHGDRVRLTSLRWSNPDKQSGPRCIEAPFFVALGNGEHAWRCLERTCSVTVAFRRKEATMQAIIERCCGL